MARPPRIEFAGAVYYVTASSNIRGDIYRNDADFTTFLDLLQQTCERHDWVCHAYCLLGNQYYLVLETRSATLSKGMKFLSGAYTQYFNRKYHHGGAIFQGRFKAIIIERSKYLLDVCRDVVTTPARNSAVRTIKDFLWSSYRSTAGLTSAHGALTVDWVLAQFGKQRKTSESGYRKFIQDMDKGSSPWDNVQQQIFLGSEVFIEKLKRQLKPAMMARGNAKQQKASAERAIAKFEKKHTDRNVAMVMAYHSGDFSLQEVGDYFDVSYATVSRAVNAFERGEGNA